MEPHILFSPACKKLLERGPESKTLYIFLCLTDCRGSCGGGGGGGDDGASKSYGKTSCGGGGAKTSRGAPSRTSCFKSHCVWRGSCSSDLAGRSSDGDRDSGELETAL